MKVTMRTSGNELVAFFSKAEQILFEKIAAALFELGQKYNTIIRERGEDESWRNHSGNLRSSIGAAVYSKGKQLFRTSFSTVGSGSRGSAKGRQMADELAAQYSDTFALAIIAAEDYAEKVEAIEGKDVLASAQIGVERELKGVIENAVKKAEREIQALADKL